MNRKGVYDRWNSSKVSINKMNKISERNFEAFVDCIDQLLDNFTEDSVNNYKSNIVNFLIHPIIQGLSIYEITQEHVEEYIIEMYEEGIADNTINNKIRFVQKLFELEAPENYHNIDWNGLTTKASEIATRNKAQILTAKDISNCRELYKSDLRKRYVFEMMLQTDVKDKTISHFKTSKLLIEEKEEQRIYTIIESKKNTEAIPELLGELILEMENRGYHGFDLKTCIEQMKEELKPLGITNFKRSDLTLYRKERFITCPECGTRYEATESNWCLKKYNKSDTYYIVCRERCAK